MSKIFKKFSNTLYRMKNETVHQLDLFGQLPGFTPYSLTNSNFTLAVSIASQFTQPTKGLNKYYNLNISQCTRQRIRDEKTGNTTVQLDCQQIPIETCNMSHFTTELQQKYFSTIRFGAVQCINREYLQNNPLILQGQFNALTYKYLLITFSPCKNTTEFKGCAPKEEINKILEAGQYNVYKSDYLTQYEQSGHPYSQIITNEFTSFSLTTSKTIVHSYRIMSTQTDQGLIQEENYIDTNLQQSEWRELSDFYNNQYLVCHYIKLDFKQTNIKRTYIKLQTILAKIGGILQILTMIIGIFLKPIIDNLMKFEIASSLFSYDDHQQEQIISIEREIQSPQSWKKFSSFFQSDDQSQTKVKLSQTSCLEIFLIIFGLKKLKYKQFCKAKKKIIKNLDIVTILKKLQDLDVIKKILFTQEQLEQLKKRPRPKLWINKQDSIIEKDLQKPEQGFNKSNIYSSQCSDVTHNSQKVQTLFKSYIESQFFQYFNHPRQQQQQQSREFQQQQQQQTNTNLLQDQDQNQKSNQINNQNDQSPELQQLEKKINLDISIQQ